MKINMNSETYKFLKRNEEGNEKLRKIELEKQRVELKKKARFDWFADHVFEMLTFVIALIALLRTL